MTVAARITQADMERATKAVAAAKIERARIVMDLNKARIEIIVGESGEHDALPADEQWDDDDI